MDEVNEWLDAHYDELCPEIELDTINFDEIDFVNVDAIEPEDVL